MLGGRAAYRFLCRSILPLLELPSHSSTLRPLDFAFSSRCNFLRIAACSQIERTYSRHSSSSQPNTKSMADICITAKVQLHIHLDGSPRLSSILPMARKRGIELPCTTEEELRKAVVMTEPETLTTFLGRFRFWAPAYTGCLDAVRQLALEFAEDMAADNVIYTEARFCPHLLIGDTSITPDEIVEVVIEEFDKAEKKLDIQLRIILTCLRSLPEYSLDIVRLCEKYKDQGVVGIDIAGDENDMKDHPTDPVHFEAFEIAKEKGINRTVHAGENGPPASVIEAVDKMFANRIGHGYRTVQDDALYQRLLAARMHFECCPYSSIYTSAVGPDWKQHPIKKFADDGFNFSISCDDKVLTGTTLSEEVQAVHEKIGVEKLRVLQTIFDGARSAFLADDEKDKLLAKLHSVYDPVVPEAKNF